MSNALCQVGIFVADLQSHKHIDEGTYALLGAASFLGGSMRLTMSACVMLLELTNNLALLPLIMVVLLISKVCIISLVPGTGMDLTSSFILHRRLAMEQVCPAYTML